MSRVITTDIRIVIDRLLKGLVYSLIVFLIMLGMQFATGLPAEYFLLGSVLLVIMESLKKGLEEYKPEYAEEFAWFWKYLFNKVVKSA